MRAVVLLLFCAALGCDRSDPPADSAASAVPLRSPHSSAGSPPQPGSSAAAGEDDRGGQAAPGASGSEGGDGPGSGLARQQVGGADADRWLVRTLTEADPRWSDWLASAKDLRLQVWVTVVEPGAASWPTYGLRADAEYFYPASAIKPLLAIAALRSLDARAGAELSLATRIMRCRDDRPGCEPPRVDEEKPEEAAEPPAEGAAGERKKKHKKLRLGEEITKLLSYSDNDSYNRLYDIVGHRELNEAMVAMGFPAVRFHHRMDAPADRSSNTLRVLLMPPGKRALEIPRRKSALELLPTPAGERLIGQAHNAEGRRVDEPMSFDSKNYIPLRDLQRVLRALLFPERESSLHLGLSDAERALLIKAMTARLAAAHHAAEHNPLSPGVLEVLAADRVRYVGKSGRAYGFHLDNAFIEDVETHRGFFVTATVYANPNGVLNDDDYGYDEISRPLLQSLGAALTRALLAPPGGPSPR